MLRTRRTAVGRQVPVVLAALACVGVTPAIAAGGSSISSAPQIAPGAQNFGNTSSGFWQGCPADYWNLSLVSGDEATVDWATEHDSQGTRYANQLEVYNAGVTDFSINNVEPSSEFRIGSNDRAESVFTANTDGIYPLIFIREGFCSHTSGYGGPFDFTVSVRHAVVLSLGAVKKLASRKGVVRVSVHDPDGQPVSDPSLTVTLVGSWSGHKNQLLGSGSPTNGVVVLTVRLPKSARHRKVSVRASAHGAGYLPAQSSAKSVLVSRR